MLKKKERIPRKTFNELFSTSKIVSRGSFFMVKKAPSPLFQASVVISKKVAKKATERNYIKRITYILIAEYIKKHPENTGIYIFLYQKKPLSFEILKKEFTKLFTV